jgi:hypothetical protein
VNADVAAEVERLHHLLARWLGTDCEPAVLDALRASHTDDFAIITTGGDVLGVDELFGSLAGARNAAPGLAIDVDEVAVAVRTPDVVVAHFRETHRHNAEISRRRTTAVLRRTAEGLHWHHVHETETVG